MRNAFVVLMLCVLASGGAAVAQPDLSDFTSTGIPNGKPETQVAPDPVEGVRVFEQFVAGVKLHPEVL